MILHITHYALDPTRPHDHTRHDDATSRDLTLFKVPHRPLARQQHEGRGGW